MSRLRSPSFGARARPSGAGAHAHSPAPLASPYARLIARRNAALVTVYERTAMPVRDMARIAGVSGRHIYALVRRLGCVPRRPKVRRRGGGLGPRRKRTAAEPLDAKGAARAVAAFRRAVRLLRAHADAQVADAIDRASLAVARRSERVLRRERLAAARDARHLASAFEGLAVLKAKAGRRATEPAEDIEGLREQLARQIETLIASRGGEPAAESAVPVEAPVEPFDDERARRINAVAEQYYARAREGGPRIRKLW